MGLMSIFHAAELGFIFGTFLSIAHSLGERSRVPEAIALTVLLTMVEAAFNYPLLLNAIGIVTASPLGFLVGTAISFVASVTIHLYRRRKNSWKIEP